jgi:hypothetical protein
MRVKVFIDHIDCFIVKDEVTLSFLLKHVFFGVDIFGYHSHTGRYLCFVFEPNPGGVARP